MKNKPIHFFHSSIAIPFILSQWAPFALFFKGEPKVEVMGSALHIATEEAAGGFAYFLDKPVSLKANPNVRLSWDWTIPTFPKVQSYLPLKKENEDFALRVGLLLSDGKSRIQMPNRFKRELKKRKLKLSHVLFYVATKEAQSKDCEISPYSDKVLNCFKTASRQKSSHETEPHRDFMNTFGKKRPPKSLDVFGIWLFADSDNSESSSDAYIADLKFSYPSSQISKKPK